MRRMALAWLILISLGASQGANEKAGREKDQAEALANGQNVSGEGPNQRLGEAQDRVDAADRKAREASASALERRGDQLRGQADVEADRLDKEARAIREVKK
jgi:hypothetical protein